MASATSAQVRSLRSLLTLRYLGDLMASATSAQVRSLRTLRHLG